MIGGLRGLFSSECWMFEGKVSLSHSKTLTHKMRYSKRECVLLDIKRTIDLWLRFFPNNHISIKKMEFQMIGDYTKYVLTKSKKCKIKSDSLVKGLNKLGIGTRYGHWVLDIDDFILFNNEKSEMTEAYENNFNTQSEKKRLKMISNELSKHITRGWIEISNIGHEGHEYVWYGLIRVDSDGSITQTSFSTGPGLVTNDYNKIKTYNPKI